MWEDITVKVEKAKPEELKAKPDSENLEFGKFFTDYMFEMSWNREKGWHDAKICPFHDIRLSPAALVFHYGQEIFEEMNAYKGEDGQLYFFRPQKNLERMNISAQRLCMPRFPIELVLKVMKSLVYLERDWVPGGDSASLYMRPTMLATEPTLGVTPSESYLFYVILSPVGAYHKGDSAPAKIYTSDTYIRAAKGGIGEAKTGGNYAASLLATTLAKEKGCSQVLWLDAKEHKFIEETGTSNIFFKYEDALVTPKLSGSILHGIMRDSVIQLAKSWGVEVIERQISIDEVTSAAKDGSLKEVFTTSTAAVIAPVGQIHYKDEDYTVADGAGGAISQRLFAELTAIQYGRKEDPFGWVVRVG